MKENEPRIPQIQGDWLVRFSTSMMRPELMDETKKTLQEYAGFEVDAYFDPAVQAYFFKFNRDKPIQEHE